MPTGRRVVGYLALLLGVLGSVIAVASAFAAIWLGATATDVVEDTVSSIVAAVDRLDARLAETASAVNEADGAGELRARAQGVGDLVTNARESVVALDDHPLFGRLPVDMASLAARLERVEESSGGLMEDLAGITGNEPVSAAVKAQMTDKLTTAQEQLAASNESIQDVGSQLRLWIRLAALAGFLVCLWGLWAQVALGRRGWKTRAASPGAS